MPMPIVSKELIESIRLQALRDSDNNKLYCAEIMRQMQDENPHLHDAIKDTMTILANEFGLDYTNPTDYHFIINIANLTLSVYSAIKQQIICDELEGA